MTKVSQAFGEWGEHVAAAHLIEAGMVLLDRNWRTSAGEIDIIARDGDDLVFCEVKTRRSNAYGEGSEAVVREKSTRLRQLATQWLKISGLRPRSIRFDVVSVLARRGVAPEINHLRDAF